MILYINNDINICKNCTVIFKNSLGCIKLILKKIKNLNIGTKILIIVLSIAVISQIIIGIISYTSILGIGNYSKMITHNLGEYASEDSESALKNQAEEYIKKLSKSISDNSNNMLEKIDQQTSGIVTSIEDIYLNSGNFKGSIPPLPDMTIKGDTSDRKSGSEKAYVIDKNNISEDKLEVLAYDPGIYPDKFENSVFRTDINQWLSMDQEERDIIKKTKAVVSNNLLPSNLKRELEIISNIFYTIRQMFINNSSISSIYIGTENGIYYKYSSDNSNVRYLATERNWYKDAVQAKKKGNNNAIWQSTYIDNETNKLCITCSKAFCDSSGNVIGVAAIDMFLEDINNYLTNFKIGNTGYSFIVDTEGKIIVHPKYSLEEEIGNIKSGFISGSEDDENNQEAINHILSSESGIEKIKIDGKQYYLSYYDTQTTGWTLCTIVEIDEIINPAVETKNIINSFTVETEKSLNSSLSGILVRFIIILIICGIIIFVLSTILSNTTIKPIKKLIASVKEIGNGNLSLQIPVDSEDEVGQLSKAFNSMTKDLQKYITDLANTTAEKERVHSELMVAKQIQSSMLPCIFPAFPDRNDFDIYAIMDPAKEVGGDFYDFFFIDNENLAIVIADVSGKGIPAALFMVISKTLIKNETQSGKSPKDVFESVNNQLCENNEAGMFVTCFMGIFNIKTGKFTFSNAGHNPPLIYRKKDNKFEWLKKKHGFVLAGMPNLKYKQDEIYLSPEDIIYLYTDGVTEAMNKENKLFSEERLYNILNTNEYKKISLKDLILNLRKKIDTFSNGAERADDITMLALKNFNIEGKYKDN